MKFTLSTKPLKTAINLVVVNANVSKFFTRSLMIEMTATRDTLTINTEASALLSEATLRGVGDEERAVIFVDALQLKALISTLNAAQVELEFTNNSLIIRSGKSSFSLPKQADESDGNFASPEPLTDNLIANATPVDGGSWKFIKDHQLYAIATSYTEPVYTYIWVGADGDVLVGDKVNSLFTHSEVGQLNTNCLLRDTVVNLITSLPENAQIVRVGNKYIVFISNDSYEYRTQITPLEENEQNGIYSSDIIISIMELGDSYIEVSAADILTALNQSALLTTDKNPKIEFCVSDGALRLKDRRVDIEIPAKGKIDMPYSILFKTNMLKSVISNSPDDELKIGPRVTDGDIAGIIVHTTQMTSVLACVDSESVE